MDFFGFGVALPGIARLVHAGRAIGKHDGASFMEANRSGRPSSELPDGDFRQYYTEFLCIIPL